MHLYKQLDTIPTDIETMYDSIHGTDSVVGYPTIGKTAQDDHNRAYYLYYVNTEDFNDTGPKV